MLKSIRGSLVNLIYISTGDNDAHISIVGSEEILQEGCGWGAHAQTQQTQPEDDPGLSEIEEDKEQIQAIPKLLKETKANAQAQEGGQQFKHKYYKNISHLGAVVRMFAFLPWSPNRPYDHPLHILTPYCMRRRIQERPSQEYSSQSI